MERRKMRLYRTPVLGSLAPRTVVAYTHLHTHLHTHTHMYIYIYISMCVCVVYLRLGRDTTTFKALRGLRFEGRHRLSGKRAGEIWRRPNGRSPAVSVDLGTPTGHSTTITRICCAALKKKKNIKIEPQKNKEKNA